MRALAPTDLPLDPSALDSASSNSPAAVTTITTFGLPIAPGTLFWITSTIGWLVVLFAALRRHPMYARFVAIVLGVHTLASVAVARHAGPVLLPMAYLQAVVFIHFLSLANPRLRALPYRLLVSMPASFFAAGTFLTIPFSIAVSFGAPALILVVPYLVAVFGLVQSLSARRDDVDIVIDRTPVVTPRPIRFVSDQERIGRPLRIVQISDPHIGPFMSVERLREICQRAVTASPDLVLMTGDFLTMESSGDAVHLSRALEPLRALEGRVFACNGNHDHEAPEVIREALASCGAKLLVDEAAIVNTAIGKVQIVGMDFHWRERARLMAEVCAKYPRIDGVLRIVLLHNPGAFKDLAEGEGDLVLSGHTHGGQLGFLSLGLKPSVIRLFVDMPDHGLWARGRDRLYVHRGTGHYGFPLRVGIPAEESVMRVFTTTAPTSIAPPRNSVPPQRTSVPPQRTSVAPPRASVPPPHSVRPPIEPIEMPDFPDTPDLPDLPTE